MDDIAPPVAPKAPLVAEAAKEEKKGEKKGFLKFFAKKEAVASVDEDIAKLRTELGLPTQRTPSIREQFENQVSLQQSGTPSEDDVVPTPPPETLESQTEAHQREQLSSDESLFSSLQDENQKPLENFSTEDLEKKLDTIGQSTTVTQGTQGAPAPSTAAAASLSNSASSSVSASTTSSSSQSPTAVVEFTLVKGKTTKTVQTLEELKQAIDALKPAEFKKRLEQGDFATWVRQQLKEEDLADELSKLTEKKSILELLDKETGHLPESNIDIQAVEPAPTASVEEHFGILASEQKKAMDVLEQAVLAKNAAELTKKQFKSTFKIQNDKIADSLLELAKAVELLDDATFKKTLTANREEFLSWIKELAKKDYSQIPPLAEKSRTEIAEDLKNREQKIDVKVQRLRQEFLDREDLLNKRDAKIVEEEHELLTKEQILKEQEESLVNRKQSLRAEIVQHNQEVTDFTKQQLLFKDDYQTKLKDLNKTINAEKLIRQKLEKKMKAEKERMAKREKDVRQQELDIPQKIKEQAIGVAKDREKLQAKEQELKKREESVLKKENDYAKKEETLEKQMQKREEQVQQAIDKLLALDEDAKTQRQQAEQLKDELDNEGFRKYLDSRLKEVRPGKPFDHAEPKKEARKVYGDLFAKIDQCNQAIETREFTVAKQLYTELKAAFEHQNISENEKDLLYDALRELYTNLQLAMLEE